MSWPSEMPEKPRVVKSINAGGEGRCVDNFVRPDGTFGFEEYRRDAEDGHGWFQTGSFGFRVFDRQEEALSAARAKVAWLDEVLGN